MHTEGSISHLSGDEVIEVVKDTRNEIIGKLLNTEALNSFLSEHCHIENVSNIKLEFIKRSLKELAASPVDLSHYASLILDIRRTGSMTFKAEGDALFLDDIKNAIRSYIM